MSIMESIRAQMSYDCRPDTARCWCRGSGWVVSDWDSAHECPHHYRGQPGPEAEPEEWDYWCDTLEGEGGGQFAVIPEDEDRSEYYWSRRAVQCDDDDVPF